MNNAIRAVAIGVATLGLLAGVPAMAGVRVAFVRVAPDADRTAGRDIDATILAQRYPLGSHLVIADLADVAKTRRVVAADFAAASDPDPSCTTFPSPSWKS